MKKQLTQLLTAMLILGAVTGCNTTGRSETTENSSAISDSVTSLNTDQTSKEDSESGDKQAVSSEEALRILKPLKEYGVLCWKMFPFDLNEELADKNQTVSANGTTFYKVVNGDIRTEEQFLKKLDSMLTERMKKSILEDMARPFELVGGDLYIRGRGAGGMGAGMDALYLDSVEYTDENTVVVTVTSFGGKDKWGTAEDIKDTASATLIKTADGFRVDECGLGITTDFYFYDEIIYGGEALKL